MKREAGGRNPSGLFIFYRATMLITVASIAMAACTSYAPLELPTQSNLATDVAALVVQPVALGQGSAVQQPVAVAIIAGLTLQLPLVLVVMPVIYWVLECNSSDS